MIFLFDKHSEVISQNYFDVWLPVNQINELGFPFIGDLDQSLSLLTVLTRILGTRNQWLLHNLLSHQGKTKGIAIYDNPDKRLKNLEKLYYFVKKII